jgi:hypothetical protein
MIGVLLADGFGADSCRGVRLPWQPSFCAPGRADVFGPAVMDRRPEVLRQERRQPSRAAAARGGSWSPISCRAGHACPSIVWIFLARGRFAAKTPAHECWISLDFLGFSRQNPDLSMGYAAFSRKNISRAFPWRREAPERACGLAMRNRGIVHGASLTLFLIFRKRLLESLKAEILFQTNASRVRSAFEPATPAWTARSRASRSEKVWWRISGTAQRCAKQSHRL